MISFDFPECGGCRTCELACSFHFTGEFNIKNSCIKIIENKDKYKGGFSIKFTENIDNFPFKCDCCSNIEKDALCVQCCPQSEKLRKLIYRFDGYSKK